MVVTDSNSADVIIRVLTIPPKPSPSTIRMASMRPECEGATDVDTVATRQEFMVPVRVYLNPKFPSDSLGLCMRITAIHEVGHTMGLDEVGSANHQDEKDEGSQHGPWAGGRHVIFRRFLAGNRGTVVFGHLGSPFRRVCCCQGGDLAAGRLCLIRQVVERVRQRDSGDVPGNGGINIEDHRHFPALPRCQTLLAEAEAFGLFQVPGRFAR